MQEKHITYGDATTRCRPDE